MLRSRVHEFMKRTIRGRTVLTKQLADPGKRLNSSPVETDDRWAVSTAHDELIRYVIRKTGARNVLEFGAGRSSLAAAQTLADMGGGRLTSVEETPEWCRDVWAEVQRLKSVDARLVTAAPKVSFGVLGLFFHYRNAEPMIADRGPYSLVIVDAPQYYYGRDGALVSAYPNLAPEAWIILDDAARRLEQWTVIRWIFTYPDTEVAFFDTAFGGRGVAVLRCRLAGRRPRFSMIAQMSSIYHALRCWNIRRIRKQRKNG